MSVETKEHVARAVGTYLFIFCLVFGMAATVKSDALKKQVINKGAWLTGVFVQFVILPFLGFALVKSLSLSSPVGITLLILTSSPGGTYSNWFCSIFNGELALSITMTVISTIIGLVMLPCNLILYISLAYSGEAIQTINYAHLYISLVTVIIAIISGLFCSTKINSSHFNLFANRMGNISGMSLLVFTFLILMYAQDTAVNLWGQSWQFYLGLATPCIFGLALATMFGTFFKLRKEERVAVATECCYQNVSICTLVAMVMFPPSALSEALVVPLYYGLVQLVVLGTYCIIAWKLGWTKAPVDESFFVVISKSYEALEETKRDDSSSYPQNSGDLQLIPTAHVLNENFNDDIVSVSLQKTIVMPKSKQYTVEINEGNKESYDDDRKVVRPKLPFFKNKSKVMEANEPTISPTSTLSPQAFEHTTKNGRNFRMGKRNSIRKSLAVQQALYIEETIIEDSLAEDPDISIAGESDLESGLSVSRHADDTSLAGFTWKRPFSRGSDNDNATGGVDVGNGFSQPPSAAFRAHTPPSNSTSNYKTQMHEERNVTPPRSNTTAPPIIIDNATDTIEIPFMEENDVESANKPSTSISSNTISSPPTILSSDTNSSSDKKNDESVINDAIDSSNMMQTAISSRAPSTPLTSTEQSNKIKTSNEAISLNMTTTNSPTSVLISENKTEDPDAADLAQVILSENKTEDPNVGNLAQLQSSTSSSLTATPSSIGKLPLVKDEATIPIAGDTTIKMISSSTDDEVDVAVESNEKAVELAVENIDSNAFTSRGKDGIDLNTNTHRDAGKEFENNSIGSQSKKLEKANNLELNSRTQMKDSNEIDDYSLGKFSI